MFIPNSQMWAVLLSAALCPAEEYIASEGERIVVATGPSDELFAVRSKWFFDRTAYNWKVAHGWMGPAAEDRVAIRMVDGFAENGTMSPTTCTIEWGNGAVWVGAPTSLYDYDYGDYDYDESPNLLWETYLRELERLVTRFRKSVIAAPA